MKQVFTSTLGPLPTGACKIDGLPDVCAAKLLVDVAGHESYLSRIR